MAILTCRCGAKNRLPSIPTRRIRCGKCQHPFMPTELTMAVLEAPPNLDLEREDDIMPTTCKKCGWQGWPDELDMGCCPDCGCSSVAREGL